MAFRDPYPYLPGHLVDLKDGGLKALKPEREAPATESVLILGTATDGPIRTPVAVDPDSVRMYGKLLDSDNFPNGASLLRGFEEVWKGGCRDVRLMRISGSKAVIEIDAQQIVTQTPTAKAEDLGQTSGNIDTVVTLAETLGSVTSVTAEIIVLTAVDDYTVDAVTNTVTIKAGVCAPGAQIIVVYEDDLAVTHTENGTIGEGDVFTPWLALGEDQVFTLDETPNVGTLVVRVDDTPLVAEDYTLVGSTLTILSTAGLDPDLDITVTYSYMVASGVTPKLFLETSWGGSLYNTTKAAVQNILNDDEQVIGKKLIIKFPPQKVFNNVTQLEYSSLRYPTFAQMVQAIIHDLERGRGIIKARCSNVYSSILTSTLSVKADTFFTGGTDGLNLTKQELFEALGGTKDPETGAYTSIGAYNLLENYKVDYIVAMDIAANDVLPNANNRFDYQLAMACAVISHRSHVCHGVIPAVSPDDTDLESIIGHTNNLLDHELNLFMKDIHGDVIRDNEGEAYDIGRFVSVLAGPDGRFRHSILGSYYTNSPGIYAGMISAMRVSSSPLNKKVPGYDALRFEYSNYQRNNLTAARYVTYKIKDNGAEIAVEDAMTAAQPGSDYTMLPNLRSVKKAVDNIREVCDPYIGEPPSVSNQNAMASAIDKRLGEMKNPTNPSQAPEIGGYEFNIICSPFDRVLGNSKIELTIQPPGTLRRITTVVSVAPPTA